MSRGKGNGTVVLEVKFLFPIVTSFSLLWTESLLYGVLPVSTEFQSDDLASRLRSTPSSDAALQVESPSPQRRSDVGRCTVSCERPILWVVPSPSCGSSRPSLPGEVERLGV